MKHRDPDGTFGAVRVFVFRLPELQARKHRTKDVSYRCITKKPFRGVSSAGNFTTKKYVLEQAE